MAENFIIVAISNTLWQVKISKILLENGYKVVEAADFDTLKKTCNHMPISIVLADPLLAGDSGGNVYKWLSRNHPSIKMIGVSDSFKLQYASDAIAGGVHDFHFLSGKPDNLLLKVRNLYQ
jgi:DNA-binding NtrC family response regulator